MKEKAFWDEQHKLKRLDTLSGSTLKANVDFLMLNDIIKPQMKVLEVGVGLGYATKEWFDAGYIVSGLDISKIAIENVKNYCEYIYGLDEIDKLISNYFDIIICVNLIQHIPIDILEIELKEILRSLKNDGIFAIQFVSTRDNIQNSNEEGCYGRTPEFMEELIDKIGGKCKIIRNIPLAIGTVNGSYAFHITKK